MAVHRKKTAVTPDNLLLNNMIWVSLINLPFRPIVEPYRSFMDRMCHAMMVPLIKNLNAKPVLSHVDGGVAGAIGVIAIEPARVERRDDRPDG